MGERLVGEVELFADLLDAAFRERLVETKTAHADKAQIGVAVEESEDVFAHASRAGALKTVFDAAFFLDFQLVFDAIFLDLRVLFKEQAIGIAMVGIGDQGVIASE